MTTVPQNPIFVVFSIERPVNVKIEYCFLYGNYVKLLNVALKFDLNRDAEEKMNMTKWEVIET